jgi:hypothetical protein
MQCQRQGGGGRKPVQITGARRSERGPDYVAYVFVFLCSIIICRSYKSTLSDQAQVTLQLSQAFRFRVKIFSRSALAGGPKNFFHQDPNPLSSALFIWRKEVIAPVIPNLGTKCG